MAYNGIYRMGHAFSKAMFNGLYQTECFGVNNIPEAGAFLLATNHESFFDPFFAGCFFRREIYFFARSSLFKNPIQKWVLERFNAIPVDLAKTDVRSLMRVLKLLQAGEGLLVFPEGTRTSDGKIQTAMPGVGMMACRVQVPVVPARIFGAYEAFGRHRKFPKIGSKLSIVYGKPLMPCDYDIGEDEKGRYPEAANRILKAIEHLQLPKDVVI